MLKMHGINLDEHPAEAARNSVIGGVTCEICQKELCSKYFLKVHKQNTHGIIEDPAKENSNHSSAGGSSADRGGAANLLPAWRSQRRRQPKLQPLHRGVPAV
ncbi:hypothetical protein MTO96_007502 [Rhipicephalus appendiculatus]